MRRVLSALIPFLAFLMGAGSLLFAQAPVFEGKMKGYEEVEVSLSTNPVSGIKVCDFVTLNFKAHLLADGWHLYSARRDGKIAYNPTELILFEEECKGVRLCGNMKENKKPGEVFDDIMDGLIRDFKEHEVIFSQRVRITGPDVVLSGEFSGQYCTDAGMCKFMKLPIEWRFKAPAGAITCKDCSDAPATDPVAVVDTAAADTQAVATQDTAANVPAADQDTSTAFLPFGPGPNASYVASGAEDCSGSALINMFLLAFLAGLGAILTPCVFPMIPMTVSFFLKQGEGSIDRKAGFRNGSIYALSIIFIYAGLGLFISTIFGPSALYTLGSHWIPNGIFFLIFLIFAMSFFGMFEIVLPSSWSTAMNNKAGQGGFFGPFFMALTLVIVSFSCTGPILGAAVVGAAQGAVCTWKPFMAFLGFGMAFGIPFGLLATFPKLMEKLPMAGGWMNTVKVIFGFLELALCMKFLSNIDLALHLHILDRQVFLGIWIVIFGMLGAYFMGWFTLPHDEKLERVSVPRMLMAIASFSFTMYMFPGLWGAPLSMMEGLAPPMNVNVGVRLQPHQLGGGETLNQQICQEDRIYADLMADREAHGFCMFYDLKQALLFARKVNKPLFVDFTGHSCANCRAMENDVWPNEKVHKLLTEEFVMVSMYADETHRFEKPIVSPEGKKLRTVGDMVQYYQSRNFNVVSQPYYVVMDHNQQPLNKPVPYTPDAEKYALFLEEGLQAFKTKHGIAE